MFKKRYKARVNTWHQTRRWDWHLPKGEEKRIASFFTENWKMSKLVWEVKVLLVCVGSIWFGGTETFWGKKLCMKTYVLRKPGFIYSTCGLNTAKGLKNSKR